jgi:hypothetical protein
MATARSDSGVRGTDSVTRSAATAFVAALIVLSACTGSGSSLSTTHGESDAKSTTAGSEASGSPVPLAGVGRLSELFVVGAPCGNDRMRSLSLQEPADASGGSEAKILWELTLSNPTRDLYMFDPAGTPKSEYVVTVPLRAPLKGALEVVVTTSGGHTTFPFEVSGIPEGSVVTSRGDMTMDDMLSLGQDIEAGRGC